MALLWPSCHHSHRMRAGRLKLSRAGRLLGGFTVQRHNYICVHVYMSCVNIFVSFQLLVPRQSYFPLVTDKVQRHFQRHVDQEKSSEMWLEDLGTPIKWYVFVQLKWYKCSAQMHPCFFFHKLWDLHNNSGYGSIISILTRNFISDMSGKYHLQLKNLCYVCSLSCYFLMLPC